MTEVLHHYRDEIHNPASAEQIVPKLMTMLEPSSVVDLGCGVAQWLEVFLNHGVQEVLGIDGPHVPKDQLLISPSSFQSFDFRDLRSFEISKRYDLAISLEVAEHLEEKYADDFVGLLTGLSDVVLFSAAVPHQTGENHVNECPPSYWDAIFKRRGYVMLDPFRLEIWENTKISWWYRQNLFLVAKEELATGFDAPRRNIHLIHPELVNHWVEKHRHVEGRLIDYVNGNVGVRLAFRSLIRAIKRWVHSKVA